MNLNSSKNLIIIRICLDFFALYSDSDVGDHLSVIENEMYQVLLNLMRIFLDN